MSSTNDVVIQNQNVCRIKRELLWRYACTKPADQIHQIISFAKSVGVYIVYNEEQEKHLLNYIRVIRSRIPMGRKRKPFLEQYFSWPVQSVSNLGTLQREVSALKSELSSACQERDQALIEKDQLSNSLKSVQLENVRLKAQNDSLKHRPKQYKAKRDLQQNPYSKSHLNKLKKKVADAAARCGQNVSGNEPKEASSPTNAAVLVDTTNLSLRQYHQITKIIPQTPKLHQIKKERRRLV